MKKSLYSGLAILLLASATAAGVGSVPPCRPIKGAPPPPPPVSDTRNSPLPPAFWLSLFTLVVR